MSRRTLPRESYTVGWICALPLELAAAQELLDEELEDTTSVAGAPAYTLGRLGDHNVVLACLPAGQIGTNSAAVVASRLQLDFPSVRFGLMVGIGGGVPGTADVRLGDVVVSQPQMTHGGVVQYDLGRTRPDKFERTGFLNAPPAVLLNAAAKLQAKQLRGLDFLSRHLLHLSHLPPFTREHAGVDHLYEATYLHAGGPTCDACSADHLVQRPSRNAPKSEVRIHHGTIASGNQVIRDGITRDKLSAELGGVLCFEMEAAGLMNSFPCLVVRGICDYADSHKNKRWQAYAAIVAAAYAKELLSLVPSSAEAPRLVEFVDMNKAAVKKLTQQNSQKVVETLDFPQMHHRQLVIRNPCQGTGHWLSQAHEYKVWLRGDQQFLWVKGKAGSGKSTLMKRTLKELQSGSFNDPSFIIVSFFYDASGHELEHSSVGLLRSVLYQLFTLNTQLLEEFMIASDSRFIKGKDLKWTVEELQSMLEISFGLESWKPTIFLLDGLDEGLVDEVRPLLSFFERQLRPRVPEESPNKLKICFSSRHYPNISLKDCPEVWVENNNQEDIETFTHLKLARLSDAPGNEHVVQSVLERADGVFLWVDLVTNTILESDDHGETVEDKMRLLHTTPQELDGLYTQIFLKLTEAERSDTFRMLSWMLFAMRRVSPLELCLAMQFNRNNSLVTFNAWRTSDWFIAKGAHTERFIRSRSRGLIRIESTNESSSEGSVQFIHQTVPGFLLRKGLAILQPTENPAYLPGLCHYHIALTCLRYLSSKEIVSSASMTLLRHRARGDRFLGWIRPGEAIDRAMVLRAREELLASHNAATFEPYTVSEITPPVSTVRGKIELVFSELPLLKYAVEAMHHHLSRTEAARISQVQVLNLLLQRGTQALQVWYSFQDALYLRRGHRFHLVSWADLLEGCVALGLESCVSLLNRQLSVRKVTLPVPCNLNKALFTAVYSGFPRMVRDLVGCGADLQGLMYGNTPLDQACRQNDPAMVKALLRSGASVNHRNVFGFTPLHQTAQVGAKSVVAVLVEAGAEIDPQLSRSGDTPLLIAAANDHLEVFKALIAHGADQDARNAAGLDCQALALQQRSTQVYAALNPEAPALPRLNLDGLVIHDIVPRAMTASPSPERQKQAEARRSSRFAGEARSAQMYGHTRSETLDVPIRPR